MEEHISFASERNRRSEKGNRMTDITLKADNGYFILKTAAIITRENRILMVKNGTSPYYYPVGGRVGFYETSESAVVREVYEETFVRLETDRLVFTHENFFTSDFMDGAPCHEVAFYYLMKQSDDILNARCCSVGFDGSKESLHWLPIEDLPSYHLYPEFFKTDLHDLHESVRHFITENERTYRCR